MKKVISVSLIFLIILTSVCTIPIFANEKNYTQIKNESDFLNMDANGSYQLANDITISTSYSKEFCGVLDGNGKKIRIKNGANTPVFTSLKNATIKNVWTIGNIQLSNPSSHAGGIANHGNATFENVTNQISVTASGAGYNSFKKSIGGFIGQITDTSSFINCANTGAITISTTTLSEPSSGMPIIEGIGGFAGSINAPDKQVTFDGCEGSNFIASNQPGVNVGGFVGHVLNTSINISNCENTSNVSGKAYRSSTIEYHSGVGGIFGKLEILNNAKAKITATDTKNSGEIRGNEAITMVGGFVGMVSSFNDMTFTRCSNSGTVINDKNIWEGVGGLVGFLSNANDPKIDFIECSNSGYIKGFLTAGLLAFFRESPNATVRFENCFNTGNIESGKQYAGGIASFIVSNGGTLSISKCVNTGKINAESAAYGSGGILGSAEHLASANVKNCVNTGNIICKNGVFYAAGIASGFYQSSNVSVSNCINAGTLNHTTTSGNIAPIAFDNAFSAISFTGNIFLNGSGGSSPNASSALIADVKSAIDSALTASITVNDYISVEEFNKARASLLSANSTDEIGSAATKLLIEINELQTVEEYLTPIKTELIAKLGEKLSNADNAYTAESYEVYVKSFNDVLSSINSAESKEELDKINIDKLRSSAEANLVAVEQAGNSENKDNSDNPSSENIDSTVSETVNQTDSVKQGKGCKSVISSITILTFVTLILCAALILKKEKSIKIN